MHAEKRRLELSRACTRERGRSSCDVDQKAHQQQLGCNTVGRGRETSRTAYITCRAAVYLLLAVPLVSITTTVHVIRAYSTVRRLSYRYHQAQQYDARVRTIPPVRPPSTKHPASPRPTAVVVRTYLVLILLVVLYPGDFSCSLCQNVGLAKGASHLSRLTPIFCRAIPGAVVQQQKPTPWQ